MPAKTVKAAKTGLRDLLLFFAFAGVPIASFMLQNTPNAMLFAVLLIVFLVVLVWMRQYAEEGAFKKLVDYDENLDLGGLLFIGAGIAGVYIVANIIMSAYNLSGSLWVPQTLSSTQVGGLFQLSGMYNDFLFNITMVAPAEELVKLVLTLAIYLKLHGTIDEFLAKMVSIGLPIGIWATLHVYQAYSGPDMFLKLASAIAVGIIIFAEMWKTSSLLAAIFVHAGYNCIVTYLTYNPVSLAQFSLYIPHLAAVVGACVLMVSLYARFTQAPL